MGSNDLSGLIPNTIGDLVNLEQLLLDTNYLGSIATKLQPDALPSQIGLLTNLRVLDLKDNYLGTKLDFDYFAKMSNLSKYSTTVTYATLLIRIKLTPGMFLFHPAATLQLRFNAFEGEILPSIGNLATTLTLLDLSENPFVGTLPTEIGNLVALTDLRIAKSDPSTDPDGTCPSGCLNGKVPTEFGKLVNLKILWLFENALTGALPSELGGLTRLSECLLNVNSLSGEIPDEFSNMNALGKFE